MLAAIMSNPDFAEVMFLVAFILFLIEVIVILTKSAVVSVGVLAAAGLAALALGFLAL